MTYRAKALLKRLKRLEPHRFDPGNYSVDPSSFEPTSKTEQIEHEARSELKQELLKHYAERNPSSFFQFDAFVNADPGDPVLGTDDEGDGLTAGVTHELMTGTYAVRVLVTPGTSLEKTCTLLEKIIETIAEQGLASRYKELERQIDDREAKHNKADVEVDAELEPF